jgi:hypothetical protein
MSELAFNLNGEPFDVPSTATGWRVRRMKQKGAPEVVYSKDGLPLVLSLDADLDDLRRETGAPGRYRLDPVEGHRPIPNAPVGYVYVHDGSGASDISPRYLPPASESVVIEAMRMNAEIARAVVDRFPQMLEAAATLLRAADGAGLPSRTSIASDSGEDDGGDDDDDDEPARPGVDMGALVAQLAPMLVTALASGKAKLPSLAEMLDWRKAAASAKKDAAHAQEAPALPPDAMTRVADVLGQLTPDERALAMALARELSADERAAWFAALAPLPLPDAVARVRSLLAAKTTQEVSP